MIDFLIVGAGISGCTFAYLANRAGYKCRIIEKEDHIGGMCYSENVGGIEVHKHGAHILKTSDEEVWSLLQGVCDIWPFINTPKARYYDDLYSLPINMNTFRELWGIKTPLEARAIIEAQRPLECNSNNLEQHVLSVAGRDIYEKLIKDYTEKQWGKSCENLPPETIRRIPIRFTFDNNYYDSLYQGIPKYGYTKMLEEMIKGIDLQCSTDFLRTGDEISQSAKVVIYTGAIDELMGYKYGPLEYRSLIFEEKTYDTDNWQGVAVVNHTSHDVGYTRTIEHRHFMRECDAKCTIVSYETPCKYEAGLVKYYSVNDDKNQAIYDLYRSNLGKNIIPLGRLAEYRYTDMCESIRGAMDLFNSLKKSC